MRYGNASNAKFAKTDLVKPNQRNAQIVRTIPVSLVRQNAGISLIELIIVILLVGILSAVLLMNVSAKGQHSVTVQADEFRRNLSHIQLLAISQGTRLNLAVQTNSYSVCMAADSIGSCTPPNAITDPATGLPFNVTLTDGAVFTSGTGNYYFDSLGRPVAAASGTGLVTGTINFNLNGVGRATDVTVSVLPITGFARTSYN